TYQGAIGRRSGTHRRNRRAHRRIEAVNESDRSLEIGKRSGTILWLTGWSMPDLVISPIQSMLPDFDHVAADYSLAETPEEMFAATERAANIRLPHAAARPPRSTDIGGPLLIAGWSLGGLLALRLAKKGFADGLLLFSSTAS